MNQATQQRLATMPAAEILDDADLIVLRAIAVHNGLVDYTTAQETKRRGKMYEWFDGMSKREAANMVTPVLDELNHEVDAARKRVLDRLLRTKA